MCPVVGPPFTHLQCYHCRRNGTQYRVRVASSDSGRKRLADIAAKVKGYVAEKRLPEGVALATWADLSTLLEGRLGLLLRNGAAGFLLVFVALALFLRFRLAFWVSLGIPISGLGAIALMPVVDVTVNLIDGYPSVRVTFSFSFVSVSKSGVMTTSTLLSPAAMVTVPVGVGETV